MNWFWLSLYAMAMLWATFWALVLGFTISGVLQIFVSKERITLAFGHTRFKSVALATGFGAASSSHSYAASCGGAQCNPAKSCGCARSGIHIRLHQSRDRTRRGALDIDGLAIRGHR